jgi:hypothetical protein
VQPPPWRDFFAFRRLDEARAMLTGINNWFTGGFDTKDATSAKAVLDELRRGR